MLKQPRSLTAFGETADALYLVDHRQRIVRWNAGAEQLLGYTSAEAVSRKCYDVIAGRLPDGRPLCGPGCAAHQSVARGELPRQIECVARSKNGCKILVGVSSIVISNRGRSLVAHLVHRLADGAQASERPLNRKDCRVAFTPRELQVLRLLAAGLTNARIADQLEVSLCTIRNHVQHILTKSGTHSRAQAVSLAFLGGLL